jgi:RNA polymerase-binding transcription factor DksA
LATQIYNEDFLESRKKDLVEKQTRIQLELEKISNSRNGSYETNFPQIGTSEEDSAQEVEIFNDNLSQKDTLNRSLKWINLALKKIDEGGYGICETCQKTISKDRLEVQPEAKICLECKK